MIPNLARRVVFSIPKMTRRYAVPAASESIKAPITLHGIDGRYATALFTAAAKKKSLDSVETELKQVRSVIDKDARILGFLEDPSLSRQQKKAGVRELLGRSKYGEVTKNLFDVLAENGRLNETPRIIESYLSLMAAYRGEVPVVITSAKELDPKYLTQIKSLLSNSKLAKPDQKLIVTNKVNPSILGGLVIELGGDETIDLSAASKIAKLNKLLTDVI